MRNNQGIVLLPVLVAMLLLIGLTTLVATELVRLLRDNQHLAEATQARASQIEIELPTPPRGDADGN